MRIGLDLDGVVADWAKGAKTLLNEKFGYAFDPNTESKTWNEIQENVREDHWKWLWNKAIDERLFFKLEPFPEAQTFVKMLKQRGDVIVMTSRPEGAWRDTIEWWFAKDFPMISGFNFFRDGLHKHLVDVDVLIEDNLDYADNFQYRSGADVILMDRAYNRARDVGTRVKTFEEALGVVYDI